VSQRFRKRHELDEFAIVHNRSVLHPQRALKCRQLILRAIGLTEASVTVPGRIDYEIELKKVAKHRLGDGRNVGSLKVELDVVAPRPSPALTMRNPSRARVAAVNRARRLETAGGLTVRGLIFRAVAQLQSGSGVPKSAL
jgi:hypothetical protein